MFLFIMADTVFVATMVSTVVTVTVAADDNRLNGGDQPMVAAPETPQKMT